MEPLPCARMVWVTGGKHGAHTATSALPRVTGGQEGGQASSQQARTLEKFPATEQCPNVTALAVPTKGIWAAVGIPFVQMRKPRLSEEDLWCLQVRKSWIGPEFQPLRLLLPTLHFFGLNKGLCKNLYFHLWLLLRPWCWRGHTPMCPGSGALVGPCTLPFPATGPLPGVLFLVPPHLPQGSAQARPPSSPFGSQCPLLRRPFQLPPVPGTLPGHRSAERALTPQGEEHLELLCVFKSQPYPFTFLFVSV